MWASLSLSFQKPCKISPPKKTYTRIYLNLLINMLLEKAYFVSRSCSIKVSKWKFNRTLDGWQSAKNFDVMPSSPYDPYLIPKTRQKEENEKKNREIGWKEKHVRHVCVCVYRCQKQRNRYQIERRRMPHSSRKKSVWHSANPFTVALFISPHNVRNTHWWRYSDVDLWISCN